MKRVFSIAMLLLLGASCASNPYALTEKGKKVKVAKSKPKRCEVRGQVKGKNDIGNMDLAINQAKNQAGAMGADKIYVTDDVQNAAVIEVIATAYKCKKY